jgi:NADH-quinone oxidoreductase subunit C
VHGSGDTSGYGLLVLVAHTPVPAERPYGGYFDEVADALIAAMAARSIPPQALLQTTVANKEITFYVARDYVTQFLWALRDDESLRFELASSISGVDYGEKVARRLHVVYELTSMTYRRHIRLEVAVDVTDAHVPSAVAVTAGVGSCSARSASALDSAPCWEASDVVPDGFSPGVSTEVCGGRPPAGVVINAPR